MRAVLRPGPEPTPPGIARWPSGSACLVPHGPARAHTISRPRESRTAGLGPFGAAAPFWFPVLRAPGTTPASPVSCTRLGACTPKPRPPMCQFKGEPAAQKGWALALALWALWAVNCNAHAPMARPVRRHGRACPPRRAASRRKLAALGSGGQNAAAMGRRRSGCNSFYHKEQLRCHPSKPTSCHTLPAPCHTMRHPP